MSRQILIFWFISRTRWNARTVTCSLDSSVSIVGPQTRTNPLLEQNMAPTAHTFAPIMTEKASKCILTRLLTTFHQDQLLVSVRIQPTNVQRAEEVLHGSSAVNVNDQTICPCVQTEEPSFAQNATVTVKATTPSGAAVTRREHTSQPADAPKQGILP